MNENNIVRMLFICSIVSKRTKKFQILEEKGRVEYIIYFAIHDISKFSFGKNMKIKRFILKELIIGGILT